MSEPWTWLLRDCVVKIFFVFWGVRSKTPKGLCQIAWGVSPRIESLVNEGAL